MNCYEGCWKHEREALLALNAQFDNKPSNWVDNTDCCKWERVHCNTTTWKVKKLDLSYVMYNGRPAWYINYSHFTLFEDLNSLILLGNSIAGCIQPEGLRFSNLEVIDFTFNSLNNTQSIISCLDGLSSLKSLSLRSNEINDTSLQGLENLSELEVLDLGGNNLNGNTLRKSLQAFSSIRELYLTGVQFKGTVVAADFSDMANLELLVMDLSSNIENEFFKSIGLLASLQDLSLYACGINGSLPEADWYKLKKLRNLDLSMNEIEGPLPSTFCNMTSLKKLLLSNNKFIGNLGFNIASLTSLEYLDYGSNQFEVPISFTPFANHSNIKFIYGEGNKIILDSHNIPQTWVPKFQLQELILSSTTNATSLPLPNFLLYQYNLTSLDFTSGKLEGEFPNWLLENNTNIVNLILKDCSFKGTFNLPSHPLLSIKIIDVSSNAIIGQIPSKNISSIFPNLHYLNMSYNDIHGSIPHDFGQMNFLDTLDLSNNHLFGEIPKNMSSAMSLSLLRLSNNNIGGTMFPLPRNLTMLFLDGNSYFGSIPSSSFNSSMLKELDLSNNHFVGKLPSCWNKSLTCLEALYMSNNHFEGSIPLEIANMECLEHLDLSQNKLNGIVPSFQSSSMSAIHLGNNMLHGLPKTIFKGSTSIQMLDLSYNLITSGIEDMIQDLNNTGVNILLLKSNHFIGKIPKELCQLTSITILDLSHNNFSGPIPSCLGKMPFENAYPEGLQILLGGGEFLRFVNEKANFTTKKSSYAYTGSILSYMSGIDLSFNKLNGNIPWGIGNLTKIRALNLSYNDLSGKIPDTFSNLVQIESLDLSFNNLSGSIPSRLNELSSLEVFSVADNNLSGAIPEMKGQFLTFDKSSYEGNPLLCGTPLPKLCNASIVFVPNGSYNDLDNDNLVDMHVFWSMVLLYRIG
ncbi:unnamed protein product [Lupinus luteus]|uniref:Leucine-rich repeat-containing N-terminal plant-type domain-containing protein n=1 Tax=Lupinus luteus TaxID=3873 RepID=A0AAV1Y2W5_LUPLU